MIPSMNGEIRSIGYAFGFASATSSFTTRSASTTSAGESMGSGTRSKSRSLTAATPIADGGYAIGSAGSFTLNNNLPPLGLRLE